MMVARISSLDSVRSERRLAARLRGHDDIGEAAEAARTSLEQRSEWTTRLAAWDGVVQDLFEANLGDAVVLGFLQLSARWPEQRNADDLVALGRGIRDIGCSAGSRLAHALLTALPKVLPRLAAPGALTIVLDALRRLVDEGPESASLVVGRLEQLLAQAEAEDFSAWITGGLRAAGGRA